MNKTIIPFIIFIMLVPLVPVYTTIPIITTSYDLQQHMSSEEIFFLRKAYPYENKALLDLQYFAMKQMNNDMDEQTLLSSALDPSPVGLSGPMNSSWPMKSYNAQRVGRTIYSTADNPGVEKWRFKTFGAGGVDSGAAVADDGTIYFGGKDARVYALYPNGTLKWLYITETGWQSIYSVPALAADGTIYVTSCDWYLYALCPNGNLKWKFNTGEIISSSPVIADDGTIYIGHSQGRVFAIGPNGTELWHYDLTNDIYGSPTLGSDGTIYIGCWDGRLYALNPNGTLQWWFPTGNHVKGVPSVAPDGTIYFGSWDGYLYALYPNGTMRWRCRVGSGMETTPALAADGMIYVGGDELYAVYPNGTMRWTFYLGSDRHIFTSCPAIAAEGTIYVGVDIGDVDGGEMLAVNPNGTERWRKIISDEWVDSSPAIAADGTVYIGSTGMNYGNGLHAFGPVESNLPPGTPVIWNETFSFPGRVCIFRLTAIDPDHNPIQFYVDWGDGSVTNETQEINSGGSLLLTHTWTVSGFYTIRVKSQDTWGAESNWSAFIVEIKDIMLNNVILFGRINNYNYDPDRDEAQFTAKRLWIIDPNPFSIERLTHGEWIYAEHYRGESTQFTIGFFGCYILRNDIY